MLLAIDLATKGLLVLGLALAVVAVLRRHSAATRYLVWSTAIGCLLVLPALVLLVPALVVPVVPEPWMTAAAPVGPAGRSETPPRVTSAPRPTPRAPVVVAPRDAGRIPSRAPVGARFPSTPAGESQLQALSPSLQGPALLDRFAMPAWPALLAGIYLLGVAAVLLYLGVGVRRVARTLYEARTVTDEGLASAFERARLQLGIGRGVRLLESDAVFVPVVWEMFRPTVLLPAVAGTWSPERQRVVMLHELAHVKRRDCQVQLLAYAALALHWFNPLAWFAVHRLRIEREHACDDHVLRLGTPASDYADHLLQITRGLLPPSEPEGAAIAIARTSNLETRVAAILDPRHPRRLPDRRNTMMATAFTLVLLLPLAALQPGAQAEGAALPSLPFAHSGAHHAPAPQEGEPTLDQLVQMRIHGVSPEFIQEVRDALGRPVTVRELVQMRIHGASPELLREVSDLMPGEVTMNNIVQLRIHGASTDYIREMQELLGDDITINNVTQMRIHGASVEFVRTMRELLPDEDLTVRDITQMRIHGVSLRLVRELQEDGFDDLTVNDLVQMKIHGFDRWLRRRGGRN